MSSIDQSTRDNLQINGLVLASNKCDTVNKMVGSNNLIVNNCRDEDVELWGRNCEINGNKDSTKISREEPLREKS